MPTSKRFRGAAVQANVTAQHGQCKTKPSHDGGSFSFREEFTIGGAGQGLINRRWSIFTPKAKSFILNTTKGDDFNFILYRLVNFWSKQQNADCNISSWFWDTALDLADIYLKGGMIKEAEALIINGSFIYECYISCIEKVSKTVAVARTANKPIEFLEKRLPHFFCAYYSLESSDAMKSYIWSSQDHKKRNAPSVRGITSHLSDDWNGSSASKSQRRLRSENDGEKIKIMVEDDANENETHSFDIVSSTPLKALFTDYAKIIGVSLRSLRFSFAGKTLFLSNAGHKTPEQLGMKNQDVIKVHDCSRTSHESDDKNRPGQLGTNPSSSSKSTKVKKHSNKKSKGNKGKKQQLYEGLVKAMWEFKVQHSRQLTEVHNEAQSIFQSIRQRLNNLAIERSQPKSRHPRVRRLLPPSPSKVENTWGEGLGGKAGKAHYVVNVGEVRNLYKTSKPCAVAALQRGESADSPPALDLHGCTKAEALKKLDESLEVWVDAAMSGSYPFVRRAVIVCGCGSQTLNDVVERWIRSNDQVSNAPKVRH